MEATPTMPAVAIITRTKNRPLLLKRALESVLNQSYENWLMVIVNDGGDPATVEQLLAHYECRARGRVKIVHNERSLGMEAASNIGIRAISGNLTFLVIHDDDDSWAPEFLTIAVGELEHARALHPRIQGVITMANVVIERIKGNAVLVERVEEYTPWLNSGLISLNAMLSDNQFAPIQFLYLANAIEHTGFYREDLPVLGDWEFNIRFLMHYDIMIVPQVLAFYHHREQDQNSVYGNSIIAGRDRHEFFRQLLKNEWLRNDMNGGVASLGTLTNVIPQLNKRMDDIMLQLNVAKPDRIRHLLQAGLLSVRSGRALYYLKQFFRSLMTKGLAKTLENVKIWVAVKGARK